jgi:hypothetical protein
MDLLEDTRRTADDVPCVVFRKVRFLAGNTVLTDGAKAELRTLAKVLAAVPGQRVQIGSRLGPGRPMATDPVLRAERARIVRNELVALGVAPARMTLDQSEIYERLLEEERRAGARPVQSIGLCMR